MSTLTDNLDGTANDVTTSFAYNPASQIVSRIMGNDGYAWTGHANQDKPETPNGLNQLTQQGATALTYDARGNVASIGGTAYSYDSENRLIAGPGSTLTYDPLGRLASVTSGGVTRRLLYDGVNLISEHDAAGAVTRRYVHGDGADEPLGYWTGPGASIAAWSSYHADERGSIVAVTDIYGGFYQGGINRYDDHGNPAATNTGRFGYTGQTWVPELGLWHYKARMYAPTLGRFMQADPIGYEAGMNLYGYVGGDPVNRVDPRGLTEIVVTGRREPGSCNAKSSAEEIVVLLTGARQRELLDARWEHIDLEAGVWMIPDAHR